MEDGRVQTSLTPKTFSIISLEILWAIRNGMVCMCCVHGGVAVAFLVDFCVGCWGGVGMVGVVCFAY